MNTYSFARLKEAREARAMSLDDLAEKLGVQKQLVYKYEREAIRPTPTAIARFAKALDVRLDFFTRPAPTRELAPVFFRQFRSKTRPKHLVAVDRQVTWAREFVSSIDKYVVLPDVNVPDFCSPSDPRKLTAQQIEESATALRRFWSLRDGVIRDVIKLVEGHGCIVIKELVRCDSIDGFSVWTSAGRPMIVIGCREVSSAHQKLDVAHELGHLILHKNVDRRFLEQNPDTHKLIEDQAYRFARAFLMPEGTFRRSMLQIDLDSLLLAKPHWQISVAAMLMRAQDLELIDEATIKRFWANRNRRGWRTSEPFDDEIPCESPRLLATAVQALKDADPDNLGALCEEVGLLPVDLARYTGLSEELLEIADDDPGFDVYVRSSGDSLRVIG